MRISFKLGQNLVFWAYIAQIILGGAWIAGNLKGSIPEIMVICVRLAIAYFAGFRFLEEYMQRFYRGAELQYRRMICNVGALAFITIPQCMQMHLHAPKESYATSMFLLVISIYLQLHELRYLEEERKTKKRYIRICFFFGWFVLGLIRPLYAVLSLYFVFAEMYHMWKVEDGFLFTEKHRKRRVWYTILWVLEVISLLFYFHVSFHGMERGLASAAVSRFSYIRFEKIYEELPKDVQDAIALESVKATAHESDGVWRVLVPALEENYTYRETNEALWRIAGVGLRNNTRANMKEVLWDIVAYQAPAFVVPVQLRGRAYEAWTGSNYYTLIRYTPKLGRLCIRAGVFFAAFFTIGGLCGLVYVWVIGRKGIHLRRLFVVIIIAAEIIVLYNALSGAGIMDYKKSCLTTIFWYTPGILILALQQNAQEKKK